MASVKVKFKNIANVKESIRREFERIKRDPALLIEIGEASVSDIVSHARAGRDAETGQLFPMRLSESWVRRRNWLGKFNNVSEYFLGFESRKSNVTFTGQFLESFKFKINTSEASTTIYADGMHDGYRTKSGSTKAIKNSKLIGYLEDKGYIFFGISNRLRKRINVLTKRFIRNLIKTRRL